MILVKPAASHIVKRRLNDIIGVTGGLFYSFRKRFPPEFFNPQIISRLPFLCGDSPGSRFTMWEKDWLPPDCRRYSRLNLLLPSGLM